MDKKTNNHFFPKNISDIDVIQELNPRGELYAKRD
jgi:hypothetical protein